MANTNVFAPATDKFVVIENLSKFWEKSKDYIDTADASIKDDVKSISDAIGDSNTGILKDLADLRADINGLSGGDSGVGSISTQINNALATLDADDAAVDGKYISSVTQVDGKITVIREDLPDFSLDLDEYSFNPITSFEKEEIRKENIDIKDWPDRTRIFPYGKRGSGK
jgi:hypothetical protein